MNNISSPPIVVKQSGCVIKEICIILWYGVIRMHIVDESREMYLKTIFLLSNENELVRSVDVANKLGYSKPSVSRAVKNLINDGSITVADDGNIELSREGLIEAKEINEKHEILKAVLVNHLKINEEIAELDACRIEHVISDETFEALKKIV